MQNWIQSQRAKLRMWNEERKREAAERKAAKQATLASDPNGGHGRFFLLHIPATATIFAAFVEVYWALLFCIEATGQLVGHFDMAAAWNEPGRFVWDIAFSGNAFVLIGLLAATAPIVMISMVWLPVQFAMRGFGRWRRGTLIAVGLLANAIVIISGTVVMNANRQEQVRAGLVQEQSAEQGRAALQARYSAVRERWTTLTEPSNTTLQAQAARAGVAGWDAYIVTARQQATAGTISPQRLALIERARGSAVAAEQYQRDMDNLTGQIAAAAPVAATQTVVRDDVGATLNGFSEQVKVWRPPLIAIGCTLIGILGAWWTLAMLLHMNPRDVLRSGWADEAHRIEDHSAEAPLPVDKRGPVPAQKKQRVYNPETGREEVFVQPKGHWRPTGKKQKNADGTVGEIMEVTPEAPPDETGVQEDGGGRIGSVPEALVNDDVAPLLGKDDDAGQVLHPEVEANSEAQEQASEAGGDQPEQTESSEPSQEYLDAVLSLETEPPVEPLEQIEQSADGDDEPSQTEENEADADVSVAQIELPNTEGVMLNEDEAERQPITDPAKLLEPAK